jgi:hypothetical protein
MWLAWQRKVYRVLVGNQEEKRPLGRPKHRWEDEIRIDWLGECRVDRVGSG